MGKTQSMNHRNSRKAPARAIPFQVRFGGLLILLILSSNTFTQFSFADGEEVAVENTGLVVFNSNDNGGALYLKGITIHNGLFTDKDFTTVAGRQSLTSKSENNYGKYLWKCVEASKAAGAYACLYTQSTTKGKVLYVEVDPSGTAVPVVKISGISGGWASLSCHADYCYVSKGSGQTKLQRVSSTPDTSSTIISCAGDTEYSTFSSIDTTNDYTMHGATKVVIMKRNVDDAAYAQASTVLNTFTITQATAGGNSIFQGEFLTYTGFTSKGLLAYGTTTVNNGLLLFNIADASNVETFAAINTGTTTSYNNYNFQ